MRKSGIFPSWHHRDKALKLTVPLTLCVAGENHYYITLTQCQSSAIFCADPIQNFWVSQLKVQFQSNFNQLQSHSHSHF